MSNKPETDYGSSSPNETNYSGIALIETDYAGNPDAAEGTIYNSNNQYDSMIRYIGAGYLQSTNSDKVSTGYGSTSKPKTGFSKP